MSAADPFPQVIPENITGLGRHLANARDGLSTARSTLVSAHACASWRSDSARPAWDACLDARAGDLTGGRDVLDHASAVLVALGRQLADLKHEYDAAVAVLGADPWEGPQADDPRHQPTPEQLAAYDRRLTACNDASRSAQLALLLAAQQLADLTGAMTFPAAPPGTPSFQHVLTPAFAVVPIAPAFGAPAGVLYANGVPVQFTTGTKFESDVLGRLGVSGEAKQLWRPDPNGNYTFPRIKGGKLYRGTYPDSRLAGVLEIKSGATSICATSTQIRLQQALANLLGTSWSLIAAANTPVDDDLLVKASRSGGSVYSAVPDYPGAGGNAPFYDRKTRRYVRLQSAGGKLQATPLSAAEVEQIPQEVRKAVQDGANSPVQCRGSNTQPPTPPAVAAWAPTPAQQPVTEGEYGYAWEHARGGAYVPPNGGSGVPVPILPLPAGGWPFPSLPSLPLPSFPFPLVPVLP